MIKKFIFGMAAAVLLLGEATTGQEQGEGTKPEESPVEFAEKYDLRYSKKKPLVGDSIGKLVAFDEFGNKLDFETLKGKYTVLNFGCLT